MLGDTKLKLGLMRYRLQALRQLEDEGLVSRDDIAKLRTEYVRSYVELYCTATGHINIYDIKEPLELDNESKELILEGIVHEIVGFAGQIYRPVTKSDHGIDGEIEFKNDDGTASGERLYLQLKSGDSYLYRRKRDGLELFRIKKKRHVEYWQNQAYPVMLLIRTSDNKVRWMDVSEYLRKLRDSGIEVVKEITFAGEEFTVESIRRLREKFLGYTK